MTMQSDCTAVLDRTHAESIAAVEALRRRHLAVLAQVEAWTLRPCPPDWGRRRGNV